MSCAGCDFWIEIVSRVIIAFVQLDMQTIINPQQPSNNDAGAVLMGKDYEMQETLIVWGLNSACNTRNRYR